MGWEGEVGGTQRFCKEITIWEVWNEISWGNWGEIVISTAGRTRWDSRWPWMKLCLQKDTFIGMMGSALVRPGFLTSLKPFILLWEWLDPAKRGSILGDIQSPNSSRKNQTWGCELERDETNWGVSKEEREGLAKATPFLGDSSEPAFRGKTGIKPADQHYRNMILPDLSHTTLWFIELICCINEIVPWAWGNTDNKDSSPNLWEPWP